MLVCLAHKYTGQRYTRRSSENLEQRSKNDADAKSGVVNNRDWSIDVIAHLVPENAEGADWCRLSAEKRQNT
jgi:hypothetical protein